MKRDMTNPENIREEDLNDVNKTLNAPEMDEKPPVDFPQQALDDTRRVKVISPSVLVAKRFFRNKLALIGLFILVFMFAFCFLGVEIGKYDETQVFTKYSEMIYDYGEASYRTDYPTYTLPGMSVPNGVSFIIQKTIKDMKLLGVSELPLTSSDTPHTEEYRMINRGDSEIYILQKRIQTGICEVLNNTVLKYIDDTFDSDGLDAAILSNILNQSFVYDGMTFVIKPAPRMTKIVYLQGDYQDAVFASNYILNPVNKEQNAESAFITKYLSVIGISDQFDYNDKTYKIVESSKGKEVFLLETDSSLTKLYEVSTFVVRSMGGFDVMTIQFKDKVREIVDQMYESGELETTFNFTTYVLVPHYVYNENNEIIEEETTYTEEIETDAEFYIERYNERFTVRNLQERLLIDIYSRPSNQHIMGTDGRGMDVLTRIMYGGRISLMIGFIVIFIEIIIGIVIGGIAGYFGKWVDNLLMRFVDVMNCIPFLPIMIIIGAVMDKLLVDAWTRLIYLMVLLGVLGWPGIARMVRGQILSLREQEFMIAAEATGLKASRRIFRHLVPNVMPQLIVQATMGLGGIIITESTLSFLGLGAKYPMATWGAMINNVSSAYALQNYTHIWIPVGLLICLTVIAFNFVGDGLRDAFDPKMKR